MLGFWSVEVWGFWGFMGFGILGFWSLRFGLWECGVLRGFERLRLGGFGIFGCWGVRGWAGQRRFEGARNKDGGIEDVLGLRVLGYMNFRD